MTRMSRNGVRVGEEAVRGRTAGTDDGERDRTVEHAVPGAPGDRRALRVAGDALEQAVSIADGPRGPRLAGVDAHIPPSLRVAPGHRRSRCWRHVPDGDLPGFRV